MSGSVQPQKTSGLAVASFVLGIIGIPYWVIFPSGEIINTVIDIFLLALPYVLAITLGVISIVQINRAAGLKGMVYSIVGIALAVVILVPVLVTSIIMSLW